MAAIYRLLCTHCTFGTSALESSTADNAAKVFGYSVRRSSLPDSDRVQLRTVFRAVERLLSYYLPKDAPAEKKESLDAHCTPRRLVFLPNLGGWQAAAHVAYRTRDTAGRPGCYFADVLAAKSDGGKSLWSPLDVLQLWSTRHDDVGCANWWCLSEEALAELDESGHGDLRSLTTPADLRGNAEPFLDDNLLSQFLNLEPGTAPDDPGQLVAPRWWAMPVLQRRALMEAVLGATINTRKHNSKEAIVIAAEPSVAALLFYGVFRLLPEKLGTGISFSTYESSPERSLTPLVATTFHDPEAPNADLPTDLYSRGFACNTFRDVAKYGRAQPVSEVGYVRHVVGLAATGNWAALDGFLAALNALQKPDSGSLDKMTEIETYVTDYVTGNKRRKKIGPEPSVERGSDKERFRRARFRGLLTTGAEDRAADWPGDLLRTAVAWLGEEFPELWTEQGPVASVLQKRLPATNKELELLLRKVQDSPESTRTRLNHMVARAVIHVALSEHAEQIPQAFADFIAAPTKDGGHAPPIPKAGDFVEALLGELVAQGHQTLIRRPSSQLIGPLLDAVRACHQRSVDSIDEQQIPLLDILTFAFSRTHTGTKERAGFLTRHVALETYTRQHGCPREFTVAVDDFIRKLLRLIPGTKQTNWDCLAADGRSRAKVLANWLSAVKPENRSRYNEALEAWQAIHAAMSELKPVAEKAGRFKALFPNLFPGEQPPRASLTKFTDAYGRLREVHQSFNTPIDLPLGAFLAASFNGLAVNEPERLRMTRWLDRALSDATRARSLAFAKLRGKKKASVKGKALRMGLAAALVLVCGGLAFGLYKQALKNPTISKLFDGRSFAGQSKPAGTKVAPKVEKGQQRQATDAAAVLPSPVANSLAPSNKDASNPQPEPLTKKTLALSGTITSGTLAIRWNGDAVKQSGETLGITLTRKGVVVPTTSPSGKHSLEIALTEYGDYWLTAEATDNAGKTRTLDDLGPLTFASPPAPDISQLEVLVNPEGKPVLRATIKQPDLSAYRECFYSLSGAAGKIGDTPAERLEAHECTIQISLGDRKPADVLGERFTFRLITSAGEGSPIENLTLKPTTNVTEALQAKLTAREQHGVYVCALPDIYPKEPVTVLELPWFIDDSKDVSQLLLLRPKYVVYTGVAAPITPTIIADPTNATRWKCGIEGGSETGSGIGFFEAIRPTDSPWRPILRFVPNKLGDEQTTQAYAQLQMCKLCLSVRGKMVATAQLVEPRKMGPMVLAIKKPIEELGFALPRLIASFDLEAAAIPAAWVPADNMSPKLPVAFSTQRGSVKQDRCAVHLRPLDPDEKPIQGYKAWVVAGTDALESRSGLTFKKADRKKVEFRIFGDWQWKRADGKDKTKLEPVATDLGDICRTVEDFEECRKEIDRASQAARHAEEEAGKAKDDKKKESLQKEKAEAEANKKRYQARLDELRPSYEINRPYHDLIVTLTSDELQVPEWTMEWNVSPDSGIEVPPTIPGTLTVIGVVGSGKGGVPLRFERDPKWEAPKKKK